MLKTYGYAVKSPTSKFEPFTFERRNLKPHDVLIEIHYCGVCHSDIHQARDEWGGSIYPMVPGHEIIGKVIKLGDAVKKFKIGDTAGVGCFVDSCRECHSCKENVEQFCEKQMSVTYNGYEQDSKTPTYGGYSSQIVVDENYVLHVSDKLPKAQAAPLLCAGITTYSPLKYHHVGPGKKVGIIGLGGLGHMGVKFAAAMGADVTVFSTSVSKEADAKKLGAPHFVVTKDPKVFTELANQFDFLLDTVSAKHDINHYLNLLKRDGTMVMVGVPQEALPVHSTSLVMKRRKLTGSLIGGIKETQEMLDFCAEKNITADIEIIPIQKIEEAYERTLKADVRYRFVIDLNSLEKN